MPLTPEDVANKQFTSTRLGRGYDEAEVDDFLDQVEAELNRLLSENEDLRSQLAAAQRGAGAPAERAQVPAQAPAPQPAAVAPTPPPPAPAPVAAAPAHGPSGAEAAAGILAMAQKTANEYVAEARGQAERMINDARAKAEQMQRETEDKRRQTLGSLETQRHDLERRIDELRAFEREYRSRLKTYLEGQLRELGTRGSGDARAAGQPGAHASPQQPQSAPQIQMQNAQPGEGQPQQAPQQPQSPAQPAGQAPRSSPFAAANPLGGADERPGHGYSDENSDRH